MRMRTPLVTSLRARTATTLALIALIAVGAGACKKQTELELYVDGFEPKNVRFEVEDLGKQTRDQLLAIKARPDVDGALFIEGGCPDASGCRSAIVSVFVHNTFGSTPSGDGAQEGEPPPVIRLKVPAGKPQRQPIAFRGDEISKGRVGRIRWLVEMYPEEDRLTATLSSSVRLVETPASVKNGTVPGSPTPTPTPTTPAPNGAAPSAPAPAPTTPTPTTPPTTTPPNGATP